MTYELRFELPAEWTQNQADILAARLLREVPTEVTVTVRCLDDAGYVQDEYGAA